MAVIQEELPPLPTLLTAYAPFKQRDWHRLCWLLDQRIGTVVRRGGEPTIAAIRLAWWDEVLVEGDRSKGGGEPLVEAWRQIAPDGAAPDAGLLIDGWRTLLGAESLTPEDLATYGTRRGAGMFGLLGGDAVALGQAGAVWALWDFAGHCSDAALAEMALAQAREMAAGQETRLARGAAPKALRLLHGLALADVLAGRIPQGGFEARHYRALLWRGLMP